jgi:hypothetical protein
MRTECNFVCVCVCTKIYSNIFALSYFNMGLPRFVLYILHLYGRYSLSYKTGFPRSIFIYRALQNAKLRLIEELRRYSLFCHVIMVIGARSSVVVKALCYKPEGRGFDT